MLDQSEVPLVQGILLSFVTVVECHFFAVINESGMKESELSFQHGFVSDIFAKRWCQGTHDIG